MKTMANRAGKPLQVYLPDELRQRLEAVAARNVRKLSAEVVIALTKHLATEEAAHPASAPATPPEQDKPASKRRGKK